MSRPRRLALAAAALGLALGATGCQYLNPVQTHEFYQAADGTNANLEVDGMVATGARNMLLLLADDGTAQLLGSVANYTTEDATVELEGTVDGSSVFSGSVTVPAGQTISLGSGEGQQLLPVGSVDVEPGATMDLTVTSGSESTTITIPVLDTTLEYYQDVEGGASDAGQG